MCQLFAVSHRYIGDNQAFPVKSVSSPESRFDIAIKATMRVRGNNLQTTTSVSAVVREQPVDSTNLECHSSAAISAGEVFHVVIMVNNEL